MTRQLSMTTRRELTEAVGERYRRSGRIDKHQILDGFVELTGYQRKHAIRVLCRAPTAPQGKPDPPRRYDDEVRAALITLWEASDRIGIFSAQAIGGERQHRLNLARRQVAYPLGKNSHVGAPCRLD